MTCHAKQPERFGVLLLMVCGGMSLVGCGSPPSVLPLLEAAERAVREEAEHLDTDMQREAHWLEQTRAALRSAYQRDLDQQSALDATWVMNATQAYVVAREELVRHEMQRREQLAQRRDNLYAVAEATHRAAAILAKQDELMTRVAGGRLWDLFKAEEGRRP